MNNSTATKLVAAFAIGGAVIALWTSSDANTRYRKVWGVTLVSIVGAALADFAPSVVGPFFGLVIVAALAGRSVQIGHIAAGVKAQAKGTA